MTEKERKETKALIELAADLTFAKTKLDPNWPFWRKQEFWADLQPAIDDFKARVKALTGSYVSL